MLVSETDLEPCSFLIHSLFGGFIPRGAGRSIAGLNDYGDGLCRDAFYIFLLCSGISGELSSNHCALEAIACIFYWPPCLSLIPRFPSFLPTRSRYASIKPFATSSLLLISPPRQYCIHQTWQGLLFIIFM